jgi:hypothetical protein
MRFLFLAVFAILIPILTVSGYTFTDTNGRFFEGDILSVDGDQVQLLRHSDGNRFTLSRSVFSAKNQADFDNWKASAQDLRYGLRDGESIRALPRQLRVDLIWSPGKLPHYEVARAAQANGPWEVLPNPTPEFHLYSDYIGEAGQQYFYRVRNVRLSKAGQVVDSGDWSDVVSAVSLPFERNGFVSEVQEAAVRFYFEEAHPVSGLSQEGAPGWGDTSAVGSTGMGMANIIVGVHRGFVTREQGVALALKMLRFLDQKTETQAGAFAHWMDGTTGAARKFGSNGTAADLVETSFLIQGAILLREYFNGSSAEEREIGAIATRLAAEVQWPQFMVDQPTGPVMMWHWDSVVGPGELPIRGFHEGMMPYILGIGSQTYPIPAKSFYTGWYHPQHQLGTTRTDFGIEHGLGRGIGWPLFFAHYSHIGFDPRVIRYKGKTYFEHFVDATKVHEAYARSRASEFKGYDTVWGLAASTSPDGYKAHRPGKDDSGTIATTAALSSMPYLPDAVLNCMESMYLDYGSRIWGCYGFYNAFNPTRDWVGEKYIGIELGPIAPMIENHRSGLLWRLFMQAPEVQRALERLRATDASR